MPMRPMVPSGHAPALGAAGENQAKTQALRCVWEPCTCPEPAQNQAPSIKGGVPACLPGSQGGLLPLCLLPATVGRLLQVVQPGCSAAPAAQYHGWVRASASLLPLLARTSCCRC